jgi:decaprenylphospho-beta-D-erythro-pentofuranosid-2-ulose 2-reductase
MSNVLIIGATSAIAQGVARLYAVEGASLYLLGRSSGRLEDVASDLRTRGAAKVAFEAADIANCGEHERLLSRAWETLGGVDVALLAYGSLPDQKTCEGNFGRTEESLHVNFVSAVSWLTLLAGRLEREGRGTIAAISSVAGDRGRGSNYVYGAAKGGLTVFLQGLRNRLARSGVHVLTVKPGFVDTPMTAHLKKSFLFATPERVGRQIHRAIRRKKNEAYVPGYWRFIMLGIRHIPESIFKGLSL